MQTFGKGFFARRVITYQLVAFTLIIALIWLDEIADIPYLLLGAKKTPANWREALFETLFIVPIASTIMYYTKILFGKIKYFEGFLSICSSCRNIRDEQGNWQQLESYIHDRSEARFSHGLCTHCAKKLYPEVFTDNDDPEDISQTVNNHKGKH